MAKKAMAPEIARNVSPIFCPSCFSLRVLKARAIIAMEKRRSSVEMNIRCCLSFLSSSEDTCEIKGMCLFIFPR